MPIYEYFCLNCKRKFELLRPMSQAEEAGVCPDCGGSAERVPSLFRKNSEGDSSSESACSTCSTDTCSSCSI
jgi:putative FmdB family regulatory protein